VALESLIGRQTGLTNVNTRRHRPLVVVGHVTLIDVAPPTRPGEPLYPIGEGAIVEMYSTANEGRVRAIFFGASFANREAAHITRFNVDKHSETSI
jgi:hypothetical protein